MMVKYYERFQRMVSDGVLDIHCNLDLFCLHQVFVPVIQKDLEKHFAALRMQKKSKSTRNPNFPSG